MPKRGPSKPAEATQHQCAAHTRKAKLSPTQPHGKHIPTYARMQGAFTHTQAHKHTRPNKQIARRGAETVVGILYVHPQPIGPSALTLKAALHLPFERSRLPDVHHLGMLLGWLCEHGKLHELVGVDTHLLAIVNLHRNAARCSRYVWPHDSQTSVHQTADSTERPS